jgi:cytochrome b561
MHIINTVTEYGLISKLFHWLVAIILIVQIPLGFYLVDLDFGPKRITFENVHIILGLTVFYLTIFRLLNNIFNPTPQLNTNSFTGQKFIARLNHILLYISVLTITISGILKKLFDGEKLNIFFKEIKLKDNFELTEQFYDIHVLANYVLIGLILLHIFAVIIHKVFFKENIIKRIL